VPAQNGAVLKYPAITTHTTVKCTKSILVLSKVELEKCARRAGKFYVIGLNHQAKNNNSVWPNTLRQLIFNARPSVAHHLDVPAMGRHADKASDARWEKSGDNGD
jgi:hypothetical protein